MHNLRFILRLMEDIRQAVAEGEFEAFRREFLAAFTPTDEGARRSNKEAWMRARGMLGPDASA
jgi:queuine/archaeosine tRNA-ribosyltransferase